MVGSHNTVWRSGRNLREDDLVYDAGTGDLDVRLDVTNRRPLATDSRWKQGGMEGVIAFARGRNEYLSGTLCEAHPEVRDYWLGWVGECIAAGVDGVDFRISCHSSWTNTPAMYGFNEPVIGEYQRRYGVDPDVEPYDVELVGALRGEFYDRFLMAAKEWLSAAGKRMQLHAEMESFRPDACQARWRTRPGNIIFNWRGWLRTGLADEATLFGRGWTPERLLDDALAKDMLNEAAHAGVPVQPEQAGRWRRCQAERRSARVRLSPWWLSGLHAVRDRVDVQSRRPGHRRPATVSPRADGGDTRPRPGPGTPGIVTFGTSPNRR